MNKLLISLFVLITTGCGVRGDPVPPEQPPVLGRGQPTYREATKDLAQPFVPPPATELEKDKNEKKKGN